VFPLPGGGSGERVRSRRGSASGAIAAAVALLVVVFLGAACGGPAAGTPKAAVLGAAVKTLDARTAQAAFTLQPSSSSSHAQGFSGTGGFDLQANRGTLALNLPGLSLPGVPSSSGPTSAVVINSTTYLHEPQLASVVTNKYWVRVDTCGSVDVGSGLSNLQGLIYPPLVIQMASGAESATLVGHQSVSGVATSEYQARLDLQGAGQSLSGSESSAYQCLVAVLGPILEVNIWLDGSGRLVKISFPVDLSRLPATSSTSPSGTAIYTLQLTNFAGTTVNASSPPPSEVLDEGALANPTTTTTEPPTTTTTTTEPPTTTTAPTTTTTTAPTVTACTPPSIPNLGSST
jgi:hypothetical protein